MSASQRRKGAVFERSIVNALKAMGLDAARVPLSGSASGSDFKDDVVVDTADHGKLRIECKKRGTGSGMKLIYNWLGDADALAIARDRDEALVVLRLADFARLIGGRMP